MSTLKELQEICDEIDNIILKKILIEGRENVENENFDLTINNFTIYYNEEYGFVLNYYPFMEHEGYSIIVIPKSCKRVSGSIRKDLERVRLYDGNIDYLCLDSLFTYGRLISIDLGNLNCKKLSLNKAFFGSQIEKVKFKDGVTIVDLSSTFSSCHNLENIDISNVSFVGKKLIEDHDCSIRDKETNLRFSFENCRNLKSVILPKCNFDITVYGYIFDSCRSLIYKLGIL